MKNTLLLVIDFINELANPKGRMPAIAEFIQSHRVIKNTNKAIAWAREKNHALAFVKVGFSKDYIECPKNSPMFSAAKAAGNLQLGEWGTEFLDELDYLPNDKMIIKHRVSALYGTDLETILKAKQIDTVVLCGLSTNMAIDTTARELHDRDYAVVILKDACAAGTKEAHDTSLTTLQRLSKVINVDQLGDQG